MSKALKLHHSCSSQHNVSVDWTVSAGSITFIFKVQNYRPHTSDNFSEDYTKNWGLWDFDVVEVFVRKQNTEQYLEIQTSPKNQTFALLIEKPREVFHSPKELNFEVENYIQDNSWEAKLKLNLEDIPGTSSIIEGNCFACLGAKDQREYFALNINTEEQPDFHMPNLFIKLGENNER